jgi:N-acetylglutamate synthase
MSDVEIDFREMTIDDYESVSTLWLNTENVGLNESDSRSNMEAYFQRNSGLSTVALACGRIIGAILAGHDGRRGYLHHLAVAPEFRKRGIGSSLVDHSMSKLQRLGIQKCHIFLFEDNASGREFWQRAGWTLRTDLNLMSKST